MKLKYLTAIVPLLIAGSAGAQDVTRGGTLTYSYNPEPAALSTIATTAVPVVIAATKIYESLPRRKKGRLGRQADLYLPPAPRRQMA
jgi:hypothetical protein